MVRPSSSSWLTRLFGPVAHPESLADARGFLQKRVTLYSKTLFVFLMIFVAISAAKFVLLSAAQQALSRNFNVVSLALFVGLTVMLGLDWWYLGRAPRPVWVLHLYETVGTLGICAVLSLLVWFLPREVPEVVVAVLFVLVLVIRAAIVPSTALRTVLVGLAATMVFSASVYWRVQRLGLADDLVRALMWTVIAAWGGLFTAATAVVSRVIYGLQSAVREVLQLGQYKLVRKLGQGGMGAVYLGQHVLLRRPTAVKVLSADNAVQALSRFEREVRETSRLRHPNTIEIYDYGHTADGVFYYAMEYVDGIDLQKLVDRMGPLPAGRVVHILTQVSHALAEAHQTGLVHRDVKPANIMLCNQGGVADTAKVLDFGLVKNVQNQDVTLSASNTLTGTPLYMAPEAITGAQPTGPAADLYALGAVGWFLLAGRAPFPGQSVVEVCTRHLHAPAEPASRYAREPISPALDEVLLRCLAKTPAQRFPDALALWRALRACPEWGAWSLDAATGWWREHGPALLASSAAAPPLTAGVDTMAVAIDGRSPLP